MKNKKLYLSILFLVLFIVNTILVMTKNTVTFDDEVHLTVISTMSEFMSSFMRVMTFFGSTIFMVCLCAVLFFVFLFKKHKKLAYSTAGILIVSTILNNVVKWIVRRPRPEYIMVVEKSLSYPSGHMMASVTMYGFIIYLLNRSNISTTNKIIFTCLLSLLVLLIGTSRIYLGAHFASDILGGACLSLSLLFAFAFINDKKNLLD